MKSLWKYYNYEIQTVSKHPGVDLYEKANK